MSDMERNKGKLIPNPNSIEQVAEEVVEKIPSYYDDKTEYFLDNAEEYGYVILNSKVYKVEFDVRRETDCPDFADVKVNEDGTIDFHTYHYNGGAHWTEVVEDGLK